jgi:uncharacterized membrane protein
MALCSMIASFLIPGLHQVFMVFPAFVFISLLASITFVFISAQEAKIAQLEKRLAELEGDGSGLQTPK